MIREDGTVEEVGSLSRLRSESKSHTRLALQLSDGAASFLYPGSFQAIEKVIITVSGSVATFDILTRIDDLLAVVDPKRVSPTAIEVLRTYHENHVKDDFLHAIFVDGYVVLPRDHVLCALTDKNKTFGFMAGSCWEITPTNDLVPVASIPEQEVVEVALGDHALSRSQFRYTVHSAYASDIVFPEVISGTTTPDS